jgi:hypothetical protein
MEEKLQLSISIVNTNNCNLLRDCLNSIYQNTNQINFEIIVVDNASDDGSVEMLQQEFPSVRVVVNSSRQGYGYSHNRGILLAKGEFVLVFNEDMIVLPNALDKMLERIQKDLMIGALGCKLLNPDGSLQHSCFKFRSLGQEVFETFLPRSIIFPNSKRRGKMYFWDHNEEREVDIVMGCCMLIPSRVLDEVGLFDTQFFVYSEEDDLCKRIKKQGYKVVFTPEAQIIHIGGQTSKGMSLRMSLVMTESKLKYLRKHHGKLAGSLFKVLTGIGATIRLIGWSGCWVIKNTKKQEAKGMIVRYAKTLALLTGMIKP